MVMDLPMVYTTEYTSEVLLLVITIIGLLCARQAVAKHHTTPESPLTEDVSSIMFMLITSSMVMILGCHNHLWLCWGN